MKTYYYLRLCDPRTYLPLEEYVGKQGVVQARENLEELLTFQNRNEAGEYLDAHREDYPNRVVQICYHLGKDQSGNMPGVIKI
jgi:hypothetical protein